MNTENQSPQTPPPEPQKNSAGIWIAVIATVLGVSLLLGGMAAVLGLLFGSVKHTTSNPRVPITPFITIPAPTNPPTLSNDPDPVFTAVLRDRVPQWKTEEGLSVLSAVRAPALRTLQAPASSMPYRLLSAEEPEAQSRNVSVSCIGGAKLSQYLSGRFLCLSGKEDAETGFDTARFGDFDGVYYDPAGDELFCLGYEVALLENASRREEIWQIFQMLAATHLLPLSEELENMWREYCEGLEYYYCKYPGWQALCDKYRALADASFGLSEEDLAALRVFFEEGRVTYPSHWLSRFEGSAAEIAESLDWNLTLDRNLALADGAGEISVLEFGASDRYALMAVNIRGIQENNPYQNRYEVKLYDRREHTLTPVNEGTEFSEYANRQTDILAAPDYSCFCFGSYAGGRSNGSVFPVIVTSSGFCDTVAEAREGQKVIYDFSIGGPLAFSPNYEFVYCLLNTPAADGQSRWLLIPTDRQRLAIILTGNLLHFAREDTLVLMDTAEGVRAYSTDRATDHTARVFGTDSSADLFELAPHEYYSVEQRPDGLYRRGLADGTAELLAAAGDYAAYVTDAAGYCVYLLDMRSGTVRAFLTENGEEVYTVRLQDTFTAECSASSVFSLFLTDRESTLIVSFYNPDDYVLDIQKLQKEFSTSYGRTLPLGIGSDFFSVLPWILRDVRVGSSDVYLKFREDIDPNTVMYPLETVMTKLMLPYVREAVADDMLLDQTEFLNLCQKAVVLVMPYIDVEADGTVNLAEHTLRELFVSELNLGETFYRTEYTPFEEEWGTGPGMLRKLAEVNILHSLPEGHGIPETAVTSLIDRVAARLEASYRTRYSEEFRMYTQVRWQELMQMRDAVRALTADYAALYASDPASAEAAADACPLPDYASGTVTPATDPRPAAGV